MTSYVLKTTVAVCAMMIVTGGNAQAGDIPVDRVILSTSGLAHFERQVNVSGNADLQFPVRLRQVDDVLKSLVVFDAKGRLGGVTLPGKKPLDEVFKDLPFDRAHLSDPMMLLNAYQGAEISVKGRVMVTGKLLRVRPDVRITKEGTELTTHRISLMTATGLVESVLEDAQSIELKDKKMRDELARALEAMRENNTSDRRMLTVNVLGKGARDVRLSYVVEAPLWKTAYRMVMPETGQGTGLLQGWAIIENMTAGDWTNVDLTLVSDNPVTYHQALYQSYYVERPEIPVQVFGRVMPRMDNGSVGAAGEMEEDEDASSSTQYNASPRVKRKSMHGGAVMMNSAAVGMPMAAPAMEMLAERVDTNVGMNSVSQIANAAQSAEATTQVLFRFPDRFNLKSGQSLMLPFVSRDVPMSRISLYQPDTHATHPLAAVEVENDGTTGLPSGILTIYEESALLKGTGFVGDAQLPVVAQGEKRMVSYALDSKTSISRTVKDTSHEDRMSMESGVLKTSTLYRAAAEYMIKAPAKEDRIIVLEHRKRHGYKLVSPKPDDVEVTETHYRIRVPVKAGKTKKVSVVLERQMWKTLRMSGLHTGLLQAYATSRGNLSSKTRALFKSLAKVRREMDTYDQAIQRIHQRRQAIFQDQKRIRENLKSLSGRSDVKEKYLDKLNDQENLIEDLNEEQADASRARQKKFNELQKMISRMNF